MEGSIDDILAKEFGLGDEGEVEETGVENEDEGLETSLEGDGQEQSETENNEENTETENDDESNNDETNENDEKAESKTQSKPSKQEQLNYNLGKLRQEKSEFEQKYNAESQFLQNMAAQYGYTDVEEFKKAYADAQAEKEAKEKGVDPELYKKNMELESRLQSVEQENLKNQLLVRAENFRNTLDDIINQNGFPEEETRNYVFNQLEADGYDVASMLKLPNPSALIKGVLAEKIVEAKQQKALNKKEKLDDLAEDKHEAATGGKSVTLDSLIAADIKDYAEKNNFDYKK